jgi:hypothetical protein
MPMLAFFPWATVSEPLRVGSFHLVPCGHALADSAITPEYRAAVAAILESYAHRRPVDRAGVAAVHTDSHALLADLDDHEIAARFAFRTRLTFAALAARKFFIHRYCNSDSLRLVVQGFTPKKGGATLITTRRRDGETRNLVSKDTPHTRRPMHVGWCELPRDIDIALLEALERAASRGGKLWVRLNDSISAFVAANTDSPDVSVRAELVELVGAFSRLFGVWDERGTVDGFVDALTPSAPPEDGRRGPRATVGRLAAALERGVSVRAEWLGDAYRLRSQYAHGRREEVGYRATWDVAEHLLLAAHIFPLTVKAVLAREGLYAFTRDDAVGNDAFDTLATLDRFGARDDDPADRHPWRETLLRFQMRAVAEAVVREMMADPAAGDETGDERPE